MLLGRAAGQRLEDVRKVGRASREGPVLHCGGNGVRDFGSRFVAVFDRRHELLVDAFGEAILHLREPESVFAENLGEVVRFPGRGGPGADGVDGIKGLRGVGHRVSFLVV